jgi:hypothetical protein
MQNSLSFWSSFPHGDPWGLCTNKRRRVSDGRRGRLLWDVAHWRKPWTRFSSTKTSQGSFERVKSMKTWDSGSWWCRGSRNPSDGFFRSLREHPAMNALLTTLHTGIQRKGSIFSMQWTKYHACKERLGEEEENLILHPLSVNVDTCSRVEGISFWSVLFHLGWRSVDSSQAQSSNELISRDEALQNFRFPP